MTITTAGTLGLLPAISVRDSSAAYCNAAPVIVPDPLNGTAPIAENEVIKVIL